jgi:hypothetical protein
MRATPPRDACPIKVRESINFLKLLENISRKRARLTPKTAQKAARNRQFPPAARPPYLQ